MTAEAGERGWRHWFYGGEKHLRWHAIITLCCLHAVYCAVATTLYFTVPAFERFVIRLDWVATALEDIVPVLWHYVVVLPQLGEREWVFLARHIAVVSLAVNLMQLVLYFRHRHKFLDDVVGHVLAKPHSRWWNGSYSRYVLWALSSGAMVAGLFYLIYFMRDPLEMRGKGGFYFQNGYIRSLFFMPLMTFLLTVLGSASLSMLRGIFSDRLRAGLR